MIPEIIHQTWKTSELPENSRNWHDQIKELHPNWKIILWTDEDNYRLVNEHFPGLAYIYNSLQFDIMRVDLVRYMYMAIFGGYYLDLDYELFKPFDATISNADLLLPISKQSRNKTILGNSIFGSVPGHAFWLDVLDAVAGKAPFRKIFNKHEVLKLTGPNFISDIYFEAPEKYNGSLVPKSIFHPDSSFVKRKNYQNTLMQTGTRGIHHCQRSWLKQNNSLINYFFRGKDSIEHRIRNLVTK